MAPVIAIIGALEKEVRQIYAAVEKGTVADEAGLHIVGGEYHGFEIVATTAGMGTVNAAAAAQHLISAHGANAIIFSGIAGGLNPALHIGDVVIGEQLRYLDTDTALIAESAPGLEKFSSSDFLVELAEQTLRAHGFVDAALSEGDAATARAEADATLFRRNNTDSEPQRFLRGTIATGDRFVSGAGRIRTFRKPRPRSHREAFPWQRPSTTTRSISSPATARHRRSRRRPAPK